MIYGYRTRAEALKGPSVFRGRSEAERDVDYNEYVPLYPKTRTPLDELFLGNTGFWAERTIMCPAWRSDRVNDAKPRCRAMAIVIHKDEEGELIYCPECLYFGENYATYS